jgi:pimeloyl-ACP methyl ester carboxylesterase
MKNILLLHGAISSAANFDQLYELLRNDFSVHRMNFPGHGGEKIDVHFSIKKFAEATIAFLDRENIETINIFGYSMGGYVGMYLAKNFPERIEKVITLATKYEWTEEIAAKEVRMLDANKIEEKVPAFAESLKKRHSPNDWKEVLYKTAHMLMDMGRNNPLKKDGISSINIPVMIMLGDRDKMVTMDETTEVYRLLNNGRLCIMPDTSHPIEQMEMKALAFFIKSFLIK